MVHSDINFSSHKHLHQLTVVRRKRNRVAYIELKGDDSEDSQDGAMSGVVTLDAYKGLPGSLSTNAHIALAGASTPQSARANHPSAR